jgi:nitrogen fixation protein NifQ
MTPVATYILLTESLASGVCDSFDGHVLACLIAVGVAEASAGSSLAEALGVSGDELRRSIAAYFPAALHHLESSDLDREVKVGDEEQCLRRLLQRSRSTPGPFSLMLSAMVARRCTRPNHLWQDLGLANRGELSALMSRHFAPLARRNHQDMKWKKFFYRMICSDESYRLCVAPSCAECRDFDACFGDESGESLLARIRFQMDVPGLDSHRTLRVD